MTTFSIAQNLDQALQALADGARPVAGGTDLVVASRQGKSPLPDTLVAIDRLDELAGVALNDEGLRIGAMVTHAQLMVDPTLVGHYSAIADAAALVGSPSTRNVGTLGGNVMNGSPAMDTGAPLMVLGATAELQTTTASRQVSMHELWTGPGQISAGGDELCVALNMPAPPANSGSAYVRLEYRRAMEIAVVGAAASVTLDPDGNIAEAQIALTAVAPTILPVDLGDTVSGKPVDDTTLAAVADIASETATPISDLRASDRYRRHTVGVMARRALEAAARRASGETIAIPVNRAIGIGAAR